MVDVSTFEDPIDVKLAMLLHFTRSMCRSTFEDPIDVNFIIIVVTVVAPRVCVWACS